MFYKKLLLALITVFGLNGCFSSHYYILSTASQPKKVVDKHYLSIGVEKVTVPEYLFKREIAVAKSLSEVTFVSDGTWAEDMDAGLTTRLISFLQKKFNAPNVHLYPWDTTKQPDIKLKVQISRFIAYNGYVVLDATYEVTNLHTKTSKSRLFHKYFQIKKSDTSVIVDTMNESLEVLENMISLDIY